MKNITEVVNNTLLALGGRGKLEAMVGASMFSLVDEQQGAVSFKFKGSRGINTVKITLNGNDLYNVKFYYITTKVVKVKSEFTDVQSIDLKSVFETNTKLLLSI